MVSFTDQSEVTAVKLVATGSTATFTCKANMTRPFEWKSYKKHGTAHEAPEVLIHNGIKMNESLSDRFYVSNFTEGDYRLSTLAINNVHLSDAGRYKCSNRWSSNNVRTFELIVIRKFFTFVQTSSSGDVTLREVCLTCGRLS